MLTCVPSYGLDYKSQKEVKAAWAEGKDFTIRDMSSPYDGRQINKQDADTGKETVLIYFSRQTKSVVIKPQAVVKPQPVTIGTVTIDPTAANKRDIIRIQIG